MALWMLGLRTERVLPVSDCATAARMYLRCNAPDGPCDTLQSLFFIRRRTTAHNYVAPVQKKYRADIGMWRVARLGIPSNGRWAPLKKSGRSSWSVSSLWLSTFAYLWASKNGYEDEPNVVVRKSDCRWSRMLVKCKYFQWVIIAIQLDVILLIFLQ